MKYTHIPFLATLILVMSCMTCPVMAGEKPIVMFVPDTQWPPYYVDESSDSGGSILIEVLKAVAEPMGYTIQTKTLPNKRGWFMLENGEVDAHAKAKEWSVIRMIFSGPIRLCKVKTYCCFRLPAH